jgi:hypothetical protein
MSDESARALLTPPLTPEEMASHLSRHSQNYLTPQQAALIAVQLDTLLTLPHFTDVASRHYDIRRAGSGLRLTLDEYLFKYAAAPKTSIYEHRARVLQWDDKGNSTGTIAEASDGIKVGLSAFDYEGRPRPSDFFDIEIISKHELRQELTGLVEVLRKHKEYPELQATCEQLIHSTLAVATPDQRIGQQRQHSRLGPSTDEQRER